MSICVFIFVLSKSIKRVRVKRKNWKNKLTRPQADEWWYRVHVVTSQSTISILIAFYFCSFHTLIECTIPHTMSFFSVFNSMRNLFAFVITAKMKFSASFRYQKLLFLVYIIPNHFARNFCQVDAVLYLYKMRWMFELCENNKNIQRIKIFLSWVNYKNMLSFLFTFTHFLSSWSQVGAYVYNDMHLELCCRFSANQNLLKNFFFFFAVGTKTEISLNYFKRLWDNRSHYSDGSIYAKLCNCDSISAMNQVRWTLKLNFQLYWIEKQNFAFQILNFFRQLNFRKLLEDKRKFTIDVFHNIYRLFLGYGSLRIHSKINLSYCSAVRWMK